MHTYSSMILCDSFLGFTLYNFLGYVLDVKYTTWSPSSPLLPEREMFPIFWKKKWSKVKHNYC